MRREALDPSLLLRLHLLEIGNRNKSANERSDTDDDQKGAANRRAAPPPIQTAPAG
jgi:hypothetical protein